MHDDAEHVRYDGLSPATHDAPRHDDGRWKEEEDEGLNCADTLGKSKVTTDMSFLLSTPYPSPHDTYNSPSHLPLSYLSQLKHTEYLYFVNFWTSLFKYVFIISLYLYHR